MYAKNKLPVKSGKRIDAAGCFQAMAPVGIIQTADAHWLVTAGGMDELSATNIYTHMVDKGAIKSKEQKIARLQSPGGNLRTDSGLLSGNSRQRNTEGTIHITNQATAIKAIRASSTPLVRFTKLQVRQLGGLNPQRYVLRRGGG